MSRIMEDIKSGIKGIHGVGEALRGNALAAADRAFNRNPDDPQTQASVAKNRAIAEKGMRDIEGTNEIFARHRKGTHGSVNTTLPGAPGAPGATGATGATTSPAATGAHTYAPTAADTTFSKNMSGQHGAQPIYGATGNNTTTGAQAAATSGSKFSENMPRQHAAEPAYGATTSPTATGTHTYAPSAADTTFSENMPGQHVAEPNYAATGSNTTSGMHATTAPGSGFAEHVPRQTGAQSQGYGTAGEEAFAHGAIPEAAPRPTAETGTRTAYETGTRWA